MATEGPEGRITFHLSAEVSASDMANWKPEDIQEFFRSIAALQGVISRYDFKIATRMKQSSNP